MLETFELNQRLDPLGRRPPEDPPVDEAAQESAEMRARDRLALLLAPLGKAFGEVDARHVAPFGDEPEHHRSHSLADRRDGAKRQETHEPHERDEDAAKESAKQDALLSAPCSGCSSRGTGRGIRAPAPRARGSTEIG